MKTRNVTGALPDDLLRKLKVIAAKQESSLSALLAQALERIPDLDQGYDEARRGMLPDLRKGYALGTRDSSADRERACMSVREFVDTNILIYAFDLTAGPKREVAILLLERLWSGRNGCLSLQALQEFYVTATRKLRMPPADAAIQVARLGKWTIQPPSFEDVVSAIELHRRAAISFGDALILTSALALGCEMLWSEELADSSQWGSLVVHNPFH